MAPRHATAGVRPELPDHSRSLSKLLSLVTTFEVEPRDGRSLVRISTSWDGASGIGGFFERAFAPKAMRRIYLDELDRLNAYATAQP
jgi:hypothetical protein